MNVSQYLEKIQNDESIFPMDSPSKKKKTRKYYSEANSKSKASNPIVCKNMHHQTNNLRSL